MRIQKLPQSNRTGAEDGASLASQTGKRAANGATVENQNSAYPEIHSNKRSKSSTHPESVTRKG